MFDDFDTQIQSDEMFNDNEYWQYCEDQYLNDQHINEEHEDINPEEYDDWITYVYVNQST